MGPEKAAYRGGCPNLPEPPEGAIRHAIDDPLSELAREGARRMLAQGAGKDLKLPDGRDRAVRHGHGPHRAIQTGVGPVEVRRAKVRDRGDVGAAEKIRFTSSILPKWARRTKSLGALLPVLYLCGVCRPATSRRCSQPSRAGTRRTSRPP